METILLMLSGGVDSTCLLHYYLTETKHHIHVHHISLRYPHLRRWIMEDPAVKKILAYCRRNYRHFDYSRSRFDMDPMNLIGYDQALQLLVASKVAPNLPGERVSVAIGHCYDDFDSPDAQEMGRLKTMQKLWLALREGCFQRGERLNPERARPFFDMEWTKEEICRRIPAELMRLCWSCRHPDYVGEEGIPCGTCKTCMQLETILGKSGQAEEFPNLVRPRHLPKKGGHPLVDSKPSPVERADDRPQDSNPLPVERADDRLVDSNPAPVERADDRAASAVPESGSHRIPPAVREGSVPDGTRTFNPTFKARVALAALNNGKSDEHSAGQFDVDPALVSTWKQMLLDGMASAFLSGPEHYHPQSFKGGDPVQIQNEIDTLKSRIRQLESKMNGNS